MARSTFLAVLPARPLAGAALLAAVVSCIGLVGCDDEKPKAKVDAGSADAEATGPVLDGELAAAVAAAAASASAKPSSGAGAADGPPETGVFTAGKADQVLGRGKAPKIELLSEGTEPRVVLTPKLDAAGEQKGRVTVGLRMGPQSALPTIDFDLVTKVDKADDKDAKDAPSKPDKAKPGEKDASQPVFVSTKIAGAKLAAKQPGALPKELEAEVAKLKGGVVRCEVVRSGGVLGCTTQMPKGAHEGLEGAVKALAESLALMRPPAPDKPVGVGAYWMVTDRTVIAAVAGIDGLRYRVFKVESIDKGAIKLSIDVRQYAASDTFEQPGAQKGAPMSIEVLESQGKGAVAISAGALLPDGGDMNVKLNARLRVGQGTQRPMVQLEMTSKLGDGGGAD